MARCLSTLHRTGHLNSSAEQEKLFCKRRLARVRMGNDCKSAAPVYFVDEGSHSAFNSSTTSHYMPRNADRCADGPRSRHWSPVQIDPHARERFTTRRHPRFGLDCASYSRRLPFGMHEVCKHESRRLDVRTAIDKAIYSNYSRTTHPDRQRGRPFEAGATSAARKVPIPAERACRTFRKMGGRRGLRRTLPVRRLVIRRPKWFLFIPSHPFQSHRAAIARALTRPSTARVMALAGEMVA